MIELLLRNRMLRTLLHLWWLPAVAGVLLWALPGRHDFDLLGRGVLAILAWFGGLVGAACALDAMLERRASARRRALGHRFLCPHCLHGDTFRYACATCGTEAPPALVHTRGALVDDCRQCETVLFPKDAAPHLHAYCRRCWSRLDPERYHARGVRVLGTLFPRDQVRLARAVGTLLEPNDGAVVVGDDGARLTYVLPLYDFTEGAWAMPEEHAMRQVTGIWLDGAEVEPLALGQVVDRFIRQSGYSDEQLRSLTVQVGQTELPAAAHHLLATRFGGVQYGVASRDLLLDGSSGWELAPLPFAHLALPEAGGVGSGARRIETPSTHPAERRGMQLVEPGPDALVRARDRKRAVR